MARRRRRRKKVKKSPKNIVTPTPFEPVGLTKKEALLVNQAEREKCKAKRMIKDYRSPFLLFYEAKIPSGP